MEDNTIHILLIDDVKFDVSEIKRQLGDTMIVPFVITHLEDFKDSLELLKINDIKLTLFYWIWA